MSITTQELHLPELWQDLRQHLESRIYDTYMGLHLPECL
jgi:F-type H+-transporting ATPase subunit epsilon